MRTLKLLILFCLIVTGCRQETANDVTLVLPTGKYVNWTNFEPVNIAFKLRNDSLLIDSNYDSATSVFVIRGIEPPDSFPLTAAFLKMKVAEYESLSRAIDSASCTRLTPVYVEHKQGTGLRLINFKTVAACNVHKDSVPNIVMELGTLRHKYTRN